MENTNFIAYYRVSTRKQGLGLEAQKATAEAFVQSRKATIVSEYSEKESGKRENLENRTELKKALSECQTKKCVLLVAKLDRLARDAEFIFHLMNSGVQFTSCDLPDFNTLTGGVMAVMAQHERECCSRRTKEALQARKAQGVKLGAQNGLSHVYNDNDRAKGWKCNREKAERNENNRKAWHFIETRYKEMTLEQLANLLNTECYKTPSGRGNWSRVQVSRLIQRYA